MIEKGIRGGIYRAIYCAYTEEVNKIALSSNDDKRSQTLTELQHIHMELMLLKYGEVRY